MRQVALFGGTFDPLHEGHVALMKAALRVLDIDRMYVLPTSQNPLKTKPFLPTSKRLQALRKVLKSMDRVSMCLYHVNCKKKSYAIDAVSYFKKRFGKNSHIIWITGSDIFEGLHKWKSYKTFLQQVTLAVVQRKGYSIPEMYKRRCIKIPMKIYPLSSSEIRSQEISYE